MKTTTNTGWNVRQVLASLLRSQCRNPKPHTRFAHLEQLESRQLMTANYDPASRRLTVDATTGNDVIRLTRTGASMGVQLNGSIDRITGWAPTSVASIPAAAVDSVLIRGMAGNDTYSFDTDFALGLVEIDESGGGVDTLDFSMTSARSVSINLENSGWQTVNDGLKLKLGSTITVENVVGGALGDFIFGNALDNKITGGGGDDNLQGGKSGNDTYVFDTDLALGSDIVSDGIGFDTLDFSATDTRSIRLDLGSPAPQVVNAGLKLTIANALIEVVLGGANDDYLVGGPRNCVLVGGNGNDSLIGGGGQNVLIGGKGSDKITGGTKEDLLIAGTTVYDRSPAQLRTIFTEWTNTATPFNLRRANLRAGLPDGVRLAGTAVADDGAPDFLTGGSSRDWFFANVVDVTDFIAPDVLDII